MRRTVHTSRRASARLVVVVTAIIGMLVPALPAAASLSAQVVASEQLAAGVRHEQLQIRLGDGAIARGNLVRFTEGQAGVELRPRIGNGTIAGLETMTPMARSALRRGAVAGVNGGYFLPRPTGTPNGPFVLDGALRSGAAVGASGSRLTEGRGTIGIRPDGRVLLDRVQPMMSLTLPDGGAPLAVDEVNRTPRCPPAAPVTCPSGGEVLLFDDGFGTTVPVPAGSTAIVLDARRLPVAARLTATVNSVRTHTAATRLTVPDRQLLVIAYGPDRGPRTALMQPGDTVTVDTTIQAAATAGWDELLHVLPGAPLLLRDGQRQPALFDTATRRDANEALGDAHRLGRQPRTALGRTRSGEVLLLTIDGRRTGWSVGVTLLELTRIFEGLGARDAVNLDGGGPTTMTLHGSIVNRPSESGRGSANALFLHVPQRTWFLRNALSGGEANIVGSFAFSGDEVLSCDWNGDGVDTPGSFTNSRWVLSNQPDGSGALRTFRYGFQAGDVPLCGDFNGDGRDTIGIHRGNAFYLRNSNSAGTADIVFAYGRAGDVAVVGDFNGNGRDTIGVRRGARYFLRNTLSGGRANLDFHYGRASDTPVIGDFNGNGRDTVGVRRGNRYFLRNSNSGGPANLDFHYGRASDLPVVGDFNGNGQDSPGVVR